MDAAAVPSLAAAWFLAGDAVALTALLPLAHRLVRRLPPHGSLLLAGAAGAVSVVGLWPSDSAAAFARFAAMLGPVEAVRAMIAVHGGAWVAGAAGRMMLVAMAVAACGLPRGSPPGKGDVA